MRRILLFVLLLFFQFGYTQCPFPVVLNTSGNCPGSTLTVSTSHTVSKIDWYNGTTPVSSVTATAPVSGVSVAGNNGVGYAADQLYRPNGVYVDAAGNVYVVDQMNNRIQKWAPGATNGITVVGSSATLNDPAGIFIDVNGAIYVADMGNHRVQMFPPGSNVNTPGITVAGGNGQGYAANQLNGPRAVLVDASGNLYVADTDNYRVQKFSPGSTSATAGITVAGGPADPLGVPAALFLDAAGNLYVSEPGYEQVRKWAPGATTGVIVAGGNGSGAAANQLNAPVGIFVDNLGNLYVADQMNSRIQKWAPGATIGVTVAGGNGDGLASNQISFPVGIWVDGSGNIYCSDYRKNSVQKWAQQPVIDMTYVAASAGTYTAVVTNSAGCTVTTNGVVINATVIPGLSISTPATAVCAGGTVTFTAAPVNGGTQPIYRWQVNGVNVGTNNPVFSSSTLANGDIVLAAMKSNAACPAPAVVVSNTIQMTVNAMVTPSISISTPATTICSGSAVTFLATPGNGGNSPAYQWQINGTNTGTNSTSYTTSGLADGDILSCIMTSNATCANPVVVHSNNIPVKVHAAITPLVIIDAPTTPICEGDLVQLTAKVTNGGSDPVYEWWVNGVDAGNNSPGYSSRRFKDGDEVICYYSSNEGCSFASSNSIPLTVHALPTVDMGQNISLSAGYSVRLDPQVTGDIVRYLWKPGARLSDSTILAPVANPQKSTEYTLSVETSAGCKASGDLVITVYTKLGIPNAFSPNGDGRNDVFYVLGGPEGSRIKNFSTFNRWGQKIFQVQDVMPADPAFGWNGYIKGTPAVAGTYVYSVTMVFKDGTQQELHGTTMLMR